MSDTSTKPVIAYCEACGGEIREGDPHNHGPETALCESCSPTYEEMLERPHHFVDGYNGELTPAEAKRIVDEHLASGGLLTDKVVQT